MNQWVNLVDRYGNELKKFELDCAFCGEHLGEHNLYADCQKNVHNNIKRASNNFTGSKSHGMHYEADELPK